MHRFTRQVRFPALALGLALAAGILVGCGGNGAATDTPAAQQPTETAVPTSTPAQQPTEEAVTTSPPTEQPTGEVDPTTPATEQPTEEADATPPATEQPTEEAATAPPPTQQPTEEVAPTSPPTQSQPEVGHETGDRAPSFTVATADGGQLSLDSLQGRPVLLYFFTTW